MHCLRKPLCLDHRSQTSVQATTAWGKVCTCFVISSCSSLGNVENVSNLVPIKKGIAVYGEIVVSQGAHKTNVIPLPGSVCGIVMHLTKLRSREQMHMQTEHLLHDVLS